MESSTKVVQQTGTSASGEAIAVLGLTGDISSTSKDAIMSAYHDVSESIHKVLLDFSKVAYINSSGISIIIQLLLEAKKANERKIGMYGLTPHFTKVFTMVGVTKYAVISPDRESALKAL